MTISKTSKDAGLIAFAHEWAPKLSLRSEEIEAGRRLPADISEAFAAGGVYHALVPEEYGGLEVHPVTIMETIKTLAEADGSVGWNVMIGATSGLLSASLPEQFAKEIFGDAPGTLTVGVTAPLGRAEVVEDGYRVTGRWPFGSGSSNADWISGGCFVFDNGEQRLGKVGLPELHLMLFRRDQVEIEDTWHVSGLRGTGSNHFRVENQFVPEGRMVVMGGRAKIQRPLYQFPMLGLLSLGVSCVSLGIGYRALSAFKELAGNKTPTGALKPLAMRTQVQSAVAQSAADLRSAEAFMHCVISEAYEQAAQGERISLETKASLRLAAVNTTQRSVAAVDRLYQAGGGTSIYDNSVLQRCFRDVHVTTQHLMVASPMLEVIGRVEMGMDPNSML